MQASRHSSTADSFALLRDKPAGVTSHDVVAGVRRELGASRRRGPKVGHAGTLDPFATGLLVVLVGRATRLQRFVTALPKTYLATARLGWRSSTGDVDGELTETGRIPDVLQLPEGRIRQRTPMTSAARVDGERLYAKAHRGETVSTPLREVVVHRAVLLEDGRATGGEAVRARFEITCSAGTYIRTLIETLDDAYCEELRRVSIGSLRVPDGAARQLGPAEVLADLPSIELTEDEAISAGHGRAILGIGERQSPADGLNEPGPAATGGAPATGGPVCLTRDGHLIAVATRDGDDVHPDVVLV